MDTILTKYHFRSYYYETVEQSHLFKGLFVGSCRFRKNPQTRYQVAKARVEGHHIEIIVLLKGVNERGYDKLRDRQMCSCH